MHVHYVFGMCVCVLYVCICVLCGMCVVCMLCVHGVCVLYVCICVMCYVYVHVCYVCICVVCMREREKFTKGVGCLLLLCGLGLELGPSGFALTTGPSHQPSFLLLA